MTMMRSSKVPPRHVLVLHNQSFLPDLFVGFFVSGESGIFVEAYHAIAGEHADGIAGQLSAPKKIKNERPQWARFGQSPQTKTGQARLIK